MPLEKDMDISKICDYLGYDLKKSIVNDVKPVIQPEQMEGGYFGVTRLVLCYIDYLGALYEGYHGETDRKGRKVIAKSKYAMNFIKNVLGKIDPLYEKYGDLLYEMYRHGAVHLYQPKTFTNIQTKETLNWVTYKGSRIAYTKDYGEIQHMQPKKMDNAQWILPVSIICLYDDLIASIDHFIKMLKADNNLVKNWKSTANALIEFEETNLRWD
jgi:hypothetical protein